MGNTRTPQNCCNASLAKCAWLVCMPVQATSPAQPNGYHTALNWFALPKQLVWVRVWWRTAGETKNPLHVSDPALCQQSGFHSHIRKRGCGCRRAPQPCMAHSCYMRQLMHGKIHLAWKATCTGPYKESIRKICPYACSSSGAIPPTGSSITAHRGCSPCAPCSRSRAAGTSSLTSTFVCW